MSHPRDTPQTAGDGRHVRPGRVRAAILALKGHPVIPDQIRAEWAAWQLELEAVCDKISAAAARMATRDKRDLKRALERLEELEGDCGCKDEPERPVGALPFGGGYSPHKRALNREILAARGIRIPTPNGSGGHVDGDEGGESASGSNG